MSLVLIMWMWHLAAEHMNPEMRGSLVLGRGFSIQRTKKGFRAKGLDREAGGQPDP